MSYLYIVQEARKKIPVVRSRQTRISSFTSLFLQR